MQGNAVHALALEYHDVVSGDDFDESGFPGAGPASYKLQSCDFERHLDGIARRAPRAPERVPDWFDARPPHRPLFLTFDDGGAGAHSCIAPALEAKGWRGHFFVTGNRVGTRTFLSPSQLRELHDRGHVIGTHSQTHPTRMGACSTEQIREEWRESVALLTEILGAAVTIGSVPGGYFSRRLAEIAAEVGMKMLFTSAPTTRCVNIEGCLVLGRYTLRRWSSAQTAGALGSGAWVPRASQQIVYGGLNALRSMLGDHYTVIRQQFWARNG
jgi:peptidoglycan/xylan/chitin deacetylase (PgdA/CDA1 family)